jgi:pyridoxal 5'-phosphate synthase pdxT subunit
LKNEVTVGVLGVQGDIHENKVATHDALKSMKINGKVETVRYAEDLERVDGLILPGGESTVISTLITIQDGIIQALKRRVATGMPVMGTCAGMILLSKRSYDKVVGQTKQRLLDMLDIVVERNSFGRQNDSFEANIEIPIIGKGTFKGVFIRSPVVTEIGNDVEVIAQLNKNQIVGVKQGNIIGTAFHPELSDDDRLHRYFIKMILDHKQNTSN